MFKVKNTKVNDSIQKKEWIILKHLEIYLKSTGSVLKSIALDNFIKELKGFSVDINKQ